MSEENKRVILVVDDDDAGRYSVSKMLHMQGFDVIEASTGRQALEMALKLPDLILLDVQLPDISGFEVCKELKGNPQTKFIPIVHLSATYIDAMSKAQGLDSGADGYLVHPVEGVELIAVINAMLRMKNAEEKSREFSNKMKAIFYAIQDGMFLINNDFVIWDCNDAFLSIVGQSRPKVIGRYCYEVLHNLNHAVPNCLFMAAAKTGQREIAELALNDRHFRFSVDLVYDSSNQIAGSVHIITDITKLKTLIGERDETIKKLEDAFAQIKTLKGLLPICSHCKRIRNDKGYWEHLETYITEHSEALFSHGLCNKCLEKYYPEWADKIKQRKSD